MEDPTSPLQVSWPQRKRTFGDGGGGGGGGGLAGADEDENYDPEYTWFFDKQFFSDLDEEVEEESSTQRDSTKRKAADTAESDSESDSAEEEDADEAASEQAEANSDDKKKGHYSCYVCRASLPKMQYSKRQQRKKIKRRMKCRDCMSAAVGKNRPTKPLTAAELYRLDKDRFVG